MKNGKTAKPNKMILIALAALVLVGLIPLFWKSPYFQNIFVMVFYLATASMAWSLLGGMTGQNSLGHAAIMSVGAYVSTLLIVKGNMSTWLTLPIAMLVTGILAVVVFYPCFILRGPYFTLVTIALSETLRNFLLNWEFGGRSNGQLLPYGEDDFSQMRFFDKWPYFYIALAMMIAVYLVMRKINKSKLGFALRTIREDEEVAGTIGINPLKYKLIAVFISAMMVAAAGFFYAQWIRFIDPAIAQQTYSVEMVLPAIIGGVQFVNGPIIGAFILVPISELLRSNLGAILPGVNLVVYAAIMILFIRFLPGGLLSWLQNSKIKKAVFRALKIEDTAPGAEPIEGGESDE